MNQKELRELIEFLKEQDIAEFELERGDVKVRIKRGTIITTPALPIHASPGVTTSLPADIPAQPPIGHAGTAKPVAAEEGLHVVKSPIVGTFYESPSPGSPPFVKPGDKVDAGQVLCIIEAMKLMNEIEADVGGEIVKRLVNNGQPVEYGQPLFSIRPH
ncbi:MAG: acetyl-CoA carboxylase biotin carboxyl carrier protein [Acidobacteria bacterium]|nr:MAG: acetyl-CoA carboxylase biotin carboxyl carrier protein [Acidobacteriota bacterium]PYY20986.1 MAG: acetyl-CoA carboxylase biotin carboxyl carrier protein [Acidobacteriota bacterium]